MTSTTKTDDAFPLLPRSGTLDAIRGARENLARLEDTLGRELTFLAAELDRARKAITDEKTAMRGWRDRALDAEKALETYRNNAPAQPAKE